MHKRFRELRPDLIPKQMTQDDAVVIPIPYDSVEKLPELRVVLLTYYQINLHTKRKFHSRKIRLGNGSARSFLATVKEICPLRTF